MKPIATGDHAALEQGGALCLESWRVHAKAGHRRRERKSTAAAPYRPDADNHLRKQDKEARSIFAACVGARKLEGKFSNDCRAERRFALGRS